MVFSSQSVPYRGTLLIRKSAPLGSYSRTMPGALWWPLGGGMLLMSEVHLKVRMLSRAGRLLAQPIIHSRRFGCTSEASASWERGGPLLKFLFAAGSTVGLCATNQLLVCRYSTDFCVCRSTATCRSHCQTTASASPSRSPPPSPRKRYQQAVFEEATVRGPDTNFLTRR